MLLQNLRARMNARLSGDREAGFTLIELLVVMLILGILAAIAIPAFFNQRDKANDAQAKSMARTAETAMETYATDNGGLYTDVEISDLVAIEDAIDTETEAKNGGTTAEKPYLSEAVAVNGDGYSLVVTSPKTGNKFKIARSDTTGAITFTCTDSSATPKAGVAGCPSDGNWAG